MKLKLYILLGLLFVGIVGAAIWYYSFTSPQKIGWVEPPVYTGQQQESVNILKGGTQKETSLIINDDVDVVHLQYLYNLIDADWDDVTRFKNNPQFTYFDRTREIHLGFFHYWNTCPAYYLSITVEVSDSNNTRVKTVQNVGPCGSPFV